MRTVYKRIYTQLLFLSFAALLSSCAKDQTSIEKKKPTPVNSFSMEVNGQEWQPGKKREDECSRTYNGAWSKLNLKPYFNISAYRDQNGKTGADSESLLEIQVMNVEGLGEYKLMGSYLKSFESYVYFIANQPDGSRSMYSNKHDSSSFTIRFEQFMERPNTELQGVKGVFFGTLYNVKNPLDSIVISKGAFTMQKTNWYNFNQCE